MERLQRSVDRVLAELAARQHGVISRGQALRAGLTPGAIDHRVRRGSFLRLHHGVYRLAGSPVTWHQALMAATLACSRSVVSNMPAAGLWGLPRAPRHGVELSVPPDGSACPGIVVHRVELPRIDVTRIGPIRVTTVARTLIDLADAIDQATLERMFDDAARRNLVSAPRLQRRLGALGGKGRPGSAAIRALMASRTGIIVPRSVMETDLFRVLRSEGLPLPSLQYPVLLADGRRAFIDFAYPDVKLAIEADGYESRSEIGDWPRDRARQNELVVLGWTGLRVTWEALTGRATRDRADDRANPRAAAGDRTAARAAAPGSWLSENYRYTPGVVDAVGAWEARGRRIGVAGTSVFVIDERAEIEEHLPLLLIHGFPTSSFDWRHVLPTVGARRRVVMLDLLGFGLTAKPDRAYSLFEQADLVVAVAEAVGLTGEVAMVTHDMGDSVGGELLARSLDAALPFGITARVITNGSIYMDLVQLSPGQQLLLALPDRRLEDHEALDRSLFTTGLPPLFGADTQPADEELDAMWELLAHAGGDRLLPRTIRYIDERRVHERRWTGAIERHPSPLSIVWGDADPIAVYPMAERLASTRTDARLVRLDGIGHFPMIEAPAAVAEAIIAATT